MIQIPGLSPFEDICFDALPDIPTMDDLCRSQRKWFYMYDGGIVEGKAPDMGINVPCISSALHCRAVVALMLAAKFANAGWDPDWEDVRQEKFYFEKTPTGFTVCSSTFIQLPVIYFKSKDSAILAAKIVGEQRMKHYFRITTH